MTTWPGVPMTSIGNNEYSVEIPKDATNIIFSNQGSSKTDDLNLPGMDMIYDNGSWSEYGGGHIVPTVFNIYYKNNDGLTSRQTHHPTKNLTIQIMENKERFTTQRASVPKGIRTLGSRIKNPLL